MAEPKVHHIPIIMNGVTGRMGTNQHLIRSILAIRSSGGIQLPDSSTIIPEPILVGRNLTKLKALADAHGIKHYTTDLAPELTRHTSTKAIYFDAQTTAHRSDALRAAIAAKLNIYSEKPLSTTSAESLTLHSLATTASIQHGVVQDKLYLPGPLKLRRLLSSNFFGDILSVRGEFGYWVFPGHSPTQTPQRPSWNYVSASGGGIISDMLCHWQYLIESLFGRIESLTCHGATHIPTRVDEAGDEYACTAEDAAYATFQVEGGIVVHFNSSWATRVRRDDLLCLQVDGTSGSAVVGLRDCWTQSASDTPRVTWNPDVPPSVDYWAGWEKVEDEGPGAENENAFRLQWELFLRLVVTGQTGQANGKWKHDFLQGARGVMITELGMKSWKERRWVDVPAWDTYSQ
jgi:predicted dehydrogenase